MSIKLNLGGDRIGSGNDMMVNMHGYGKSTFNQEKVRRTTMTVGTIVPMGVWVGLTGDRMQMELDAIIVTQALNAQMYGTMKFQIDVFSSRMAIYQPKMLLNLVDAGLEVSDIVFPYIRMEAQPIDWTFDPTNQHVNPSCAMAYLGIRGVGYNVAQPNLDVQRDFNAIPWLIYTHIYKEYYANKQETDGVIIHNDIIQSITNVAERTGGGAYQNINQNTAGTPTAELISPGSNSLITFSGTAPDLEMVEYWLSDGSKIKISEMYNTIQYTVNQVVFTGIKSEYIGKTIDFWAYTASTNRMPQLTKFPLKNIDTMQMTLMSNVANAGGVQIDKNSITPYSLPLMKINGVWSKTVSQEGLYIKTYQSDIFNNWINNATIASINNKTKIQVDGSGQFTIDSFLITEKAYNYRNRVAAAGGTLDDWREVTYAQRSYSKSLKPVYEGGLSKEIIFPNVISTAGTLEEPLGSVASRGTFGAKHKGGRMTIRCEEESYIMVLASITPRLSYSQGNRWDTGIKTLDDLHKPEFDRIGFQNLVTDTMAWWDTQAEVVGSPTTTIITKSAGKQPSWMWYKTDYDDALGNFASTETYKVLGRDYDYDAINKSILDVTTYIDPRKFNQIFAITSLDAMNFDVQVGMKVTNRRVMSAEPMPNM